MCFLEQYFVQSDSLSFSSQPSLLKSLYTVKWSVLWCLSCASDVLVLHPHTELLHLLFPSLLALMQALGVGSL